MSDIRQRFYIFGLARLFKPIWLKFGKRVSKLDGVHWRQPAMNIEQKVDVWAERVADRPQHFNGTPDMLLGYVSSPGSGHRIEFNSREAHS